MQLTKTFPPHSAILIEKKWVENRLWGFSGGKVHFVGGKECIIRPPAATAPQAPPGNTLLLRHRCCDGSYIVFTAPSTWRYPASCRTWRHVGTVVPVCRARGGGAGTVAGRLPSPRYATVPCDGFWKWSLPTYQLLASRVARKSNNHQIITNNWEQIVTKWSPNNQSNLARIVIK